MQKIIPLSKYPLAIRILHWLMAVIIVSLLAVGLIMTDMPKGDPTRATLYSLHKSFGLTILMLFFLRIVLRIKLGRPPLPEVIPPIERKLAELGHWTLYGFMVAMPVSGYLMSTSFGLPVKWFGLMLPRLVDVDRARGALASDFHTFAAYALIALIIVHAGAVLLHYIQHRVNLLSRML
jgi:cytochrome b561